MKSTPSRLIAYRADLADPADVKIERFHTGRMAEVTRFTVFIECYPFMWGFRASPFSQPLFL
jgi:hypothetical protein